MYPPASNGTGGAMFIVPEEENSTPEMRQTTERWVYQRHVSRQSVTRR